MPTPPIPIRPVVSPDPELLPDGMGLIQTASFRSGSFFDIRRLDLSVALYRSGGQGSLRGTDLFNLKKAVDSQRIAQLIHRQSVAQNSRRLAGAPAILRNALTAK